LGAYQYLLDYHRQWYENNDPAKYARRKQPAIYQGSGGEWRLTGAEKKRILLNNIYGVDIDRQAVEVTKLSLLLKVLEGENQETLGRQLALWRERALPDLGDNVKCGNSLIGPDYFEAQLLPDEEEMRRVNPFDWESEFPGVMGAGGPSAGSGQGFDCVIGNPPYIRIQTMKEWAPTEVEFYKQRYAAASKGNYDIYVVFVERALQLLNERGRMGYILPHKFFQAKYGQPLRQLLAGGKHLAEIVHFGDQQVFAGASTYTCLLFLDKKGNQQFRYDKAHDLDGWRASGEAVEGEVKAGKVTEKEWNFVVGPGAPLFERLSEMPVKLGDVATRMYQGSITSADTVFLFKEYQNETKDIVDVRSKELDTWVKMERDVLKSVVRSGNINRYSANPTVLVLFPYEVRECTARLYTPAEMREQYPLAWAYLKQNKRLLENRERGKFKDQQWYRF
ncbi:MAG: Eco57I restriction-modification methylase domain-containing protein, partial [Anaerolineae bacterium]|nr:Eco57I restriction-modification methylase domain-containing protein [Anaerolineae bacterium]